MFRPNFMNTGANNGRNTKAPYSMLKTANQFRAKAAAKPRLFGLLRFIVVADITLIYLILWF